MKSQWQPTTFPTPRDERVHDLLSRLVSAGAAHFFADACEVLQRRPPFRTTTHLVGHLVREIESATRQVLLRLPKASAHFAANSDRRAKNATHLAEIDAVLHALDLSANGVAAEWRLFVGEDSWHGTAHRDDLRHPRKVDGEFDTRLNRFLDVLLVVLLGLEAKYADVIAALQGVITRGAPSADDIAYVAVHLAPGVTAIAHVFENLSSSWLVPLRDKGVFREPPGVRFYERGSFSFPEWPQAAYLLRISAELPTEVAATIESVPSVDNEDIHAIFLEAAARMPPPEATRVARREGSWLADRERWHGFRLPSAVELLTLRLLEHEELDGALVLMRAALSLSPPDPERRWRGPAARIESWKYGELAAKVFTARAARRTTGSMELLHELLDVDGVSETYWYRRPMDAVVVPGLEEPRDVLFALLRDLYLDRAATDESELRAVVAELEARGGGMYPRLALNVLRIHGKSALELVVQRTIDQARLATADDDDAITLMIGDRFRDLNAGDQERVMRAFRENASVDALRRQFREQLDETQLETLSKHRRMRWLHALGDARPASVLEEYEALSTEVGVPQPHIRRTQFGPESPLNATELLALTDADLLQYLRDWVPPSLDPFEPSRQGLGREIRKCATEQIERFTRIARDFGELDPVYVANLLSGIHERTKPVTQDPSKLLTLPTIHWDSVLDLLERTLRQPATSEAEEAQSNWAWSRQTAVDVAESAFDVMISRDDARAAMRAWEVVRISMSDADPTPERDAKRGHDAKTFVINTVRGRALCTAIRIAQTLRERSKASPQPLLETLVRGIEARADPTVEPSATLRATLAMEFNNLYSVDSTRALALAAKLLPTRTDRSEERVAAWAEFLRWNPSYSETYAVLAEAYAIASDAVGTADPDAATMLGRHLVWLYEQSAIDFEESSPLRVFAERAPTTARRAALEELGRGVHQAKDAPADEVLVRLQLLWDRWSAFAIDRGEAGELSAFGWWFASKHFEPAWSLSALELVLVATGGKIDWHHEMVDRLAILAVAEPVKVVDCLARIIDSPDEWQVIRNEKVIRATLTALLTTRSAPDARTIASRLVARGWWDFGSSLKWARSLSTD